MIQMTTYPASLAGNNKIKGKKRRGLSMIEIMIALIIIGVLAYFSIPQLQAFLGSSKADAAVQQVQALIQGARKFGPPNGDKTGISRTALDARGLIPDTWNSGTGANPWSGDITITVNSGDQTQVDVTFTGIDDNKTGLLFADELNNNGYAVSATYASGTLSATFEAG